MWCIIVVIIIIKEIQKYSVDEEVILIVKSYDGNYYICNTYNQTLRKNKMPCQAVAYKLSIEVLPKIYYLNRLERPLIKNNFV